MDLGRYVEVAVGSYRVDVGRMSDNIRPNERCFCRIACDAMDESF